VRREIIAVVLKAKIDSLEDIKTKSFGILIGGEFGGVVEVADINEEIKNLYKELEELDE
jgi:hypothetical protein